MSWQCCSSSQPQVTGAAHAAQVGQAPPPPTSTQAPAAVPQRSQLQADREELERQRIERMEQNAVAVSNQYAQVRSTIVTLESDRADDDGMEPIKLNFCDKNSITCD